MRRLLTLVALVALMGCSCARSPAEPPKPTLPTTLRFYPPPIYRYWWAEMERCTGFRGNIDLWQFRLTPTSYIRVTADSLYYVIAETRWPGRVMLFTASKVFAERTVKHEFIHALGQYDHDYRVFVTACRVETDQSILIQENPSNIPK